MKAWFYGLQPRERWIVAIGAAAAVVIVAWWLVISPMRAEIARLETSVDTKQRLLIDVARIEGDQPSAGGGVRQGAEQTLALIVDNTAHSHGLNPSRIRANGPSGVDVTIQDASFDAIAAWLVVLHDQYGVDVETASLTPTRAPGIVNGSLLLRRL
ncbi:MAG TPA: type II secretion system protein GspM [Gammaproteobacteria bacterium]|nr:type II secretion system protein GspM [Gammaproteobacteria bacterium]